MGRWHPAGRQAPPWGGAGARGRGSGCGQGVKFHFSPAGMFVFTIFWRGWKCERFGAALNLMEVSEISILCGWKC